jgi:hypothetical protein
MKRTEALKAALLQNYSVADTDIFLKYRLTEKNLVFIQDTAKDVLRNMPPKAFNCAQISAIWAAMIEDHSEYP